MSTPARSAVVLIFDRLNAAALGPYGSTWVDTPGCNQLAARSALYEWALADSPKLEQVYQSYWTGRHAASRLAAGASTSSEPPPTLPSLLAAAGIASELLTDDPRVAQLAEADDFTDRLALDPPEVTGAAESSEETQLGQMLAASIQHWLEESDPRLSWIHVRALDGAWDAPHELRERLADEDDPDPPTYVDPPERRLERGFDPDLVLGDSQAYAAQVSALDDCLAAWLDAFWELAAARNALLIVTSPRGFPLGEHRRVGACDDALYNELVHVPMFVFRPDAVGALDRRSRLVQPPDLFATLIEWFGIERPDGCWGLSLLEDTDAPLSQQPAGSESIGAESASTEAASAESAAVKPTDVVVTAPRDFALSVDDGQFALRTPGWMLRATGDDVELFLKPGDRCEANEVGALCPDVVDAMRQFATEATAAAAAGQRSQAPTPSPELCEYAE